MPQHINDAIGHAVSQLEGSERGRKIKAELLAFLEGHLAGADASNRAAVIVLIELATSGYFMSVREALSFPA
jgi:hypothetical protein